MNCPKCGQGRLYTRKNYAQGETVCPACGLYYELNTNKESLLRQIHGTDPVGVEKRALALKGLK